MMSEVENYCQDWHPNGGGPRTVVTIKDGVRSVQVYPSKDERLATISSALRTIQSAIPGYLKGEMSEHDFAILVLGEVDGKAVNAAMTGARASDGSGA
jgi:hypothetical protein